MCHFVPSNSQKSAKKRKRSKSEFKSKPTVLESDHSDDEISDYGNGHEVTMMMNEMDDSGSSDGNGNNIEVEIFRAKCRILNLISIVSLYDRLE